MKSPHFLANHGGAQGQILNIYNVFMPQNIRFFNHALCTLEINAEKMNEDRELPQKVFL